MQRLQLVPTWEGIKGYNPETDEFYKTFIRNYINQIGKY